MMTSGTREGTGLTRQASRLGIAGPLVFVAGVIIAGVVTPGYSHRSEPISQLATFGQPYPAIQMIGFVVFGLSEDRGGRLAGHDLAENAVWVSHAVRLCLEAISGC
jgi:hypothetical protein